MENANNKKTYSISYEWNNGYDNCLPEEKYYNFGTLTDLCGMSIKDAMKSGGDVYISINCSNGGINNSGNVNCNCNCGGGGGGGNSTGENVITITNKLVGDGLYEIVIDASEKPNADVDVSFTVDSVPYMFTLRAGETSLNTGIKSDSEYSNVDSVEYSTSDKNYKYSIVNNVKSGVFKVTYIVDNVVDSVVEYKYNEKITGYPTPEKEGYTFSGWDGLPEYMPDYDIKVRAKFTVNAYVISYYIDGVLVHSESVTYGSAIPVYTPEIPDNLTFLGWDIEIPETMPAMDLVVNGKCESVTTYYTITYIIDGEIVSLVEYASGDTVTHFEAPEKEGYTFNGWDNEPTVMPAQNVEVTGSYTANIYKLVYKVDGEVVSEENIAFGTEIIALEEPVKEGYTFSGWGEIPATMPANDVEISGSFTVNSYKLIYIIDGETIAEFVYEFGAIVPDYKAPEKEGFAFNGWDNEPDTMPAMDVTVTGSYVAVEPNEYTITYMIDGKVAHADVYKVGDSVIPFEAPAKEGYSFSGWDAEIPSVMPERDIVINGSYTVNSYKLVYKIDGEVVSETDVEFGAEIVAIEEPVKEGYTFSGWSEIPETMPAKDVEINGSFTINSYVLTYVIDDVAVFQKRYNFGDEITPMEAEPKEGFEFKGWYPEVPETMPAKDLTVRGSYIHVAYTITYMIDGAVVGTDSYMFESAITPMEAPAKEGYTFNGWENLPATMPANNITVTGSYSVNTYRLTYTIDGEVIGEVDYEFGAIVEDYKAPEKENHVFNGWDNEPDTMPAMDLTVTGSYTYVEPSQYTITYVIDGKVVKADAYKEGDEVVPFEAPIKEGYTFNGWDIEIPSVMPGENITITGSYTANIYKLVYKVDGEVVSETEVAFGTEIVALENPVKEGHTFSGWSDIPSTMPANDVEINGAFTVNSYKLVYKVDGEVISETEVEFGTEIIALEEPVREGYTFSGWDNVPVTMPANDVEINGSFTINSYKLVYKVDGEVVSEENVEFGAEIVAMEEPAKEGYTFSGWDNVPATMPANDVEINGTFTVNSYNVNYIVDEKVIHTASYEFGADVTPFEAPVKEGYTFNGWVDEPSVMPAHDVNVEGSYSVNSYKLTYTIDGEVVGEVYYEFGAIVPDYKAPEKENYVFNGWDNEPDTMPAMDLTVTGSYTYVEPSQYTITYVIDGKVAKADVYKEGDTVVPFEAPAKEGYTFNGWDIEIPAVMPGENITITGSYTANTYKVTYKVDGEVVEVVDVVFGTVINTIEEPVKEGYTFSGWVGVPETMPAMDIEINGTFSINSYRLTYTIDGVVVYEADVEYNSDITPFEAPAKEGHTFNGWDNEPSVMPAQDVEVTGSYTANTYKLTYKVDGEVVSETDVVFGTEIVAMENPTKEGYTFSGWDNVPATMPANDVEINGTFTVNSYKLTYTIDGDVVAEKDVVYGSVIETIDAPYKEGYSFNGWDNEPDTMPAMDVTVTGSYVINNYFIHYNIDGFTVHMAEYQFGAEVTPYTPEEKEGYTFNGWDNEPSVMPAENVSVNGTYSVNSYTITYMVDGIIVKVSTYEFGAEVTPYTPDEKVGYTFNGWVNEPNVMPAENIEVTGTYSVNCYTITYKIDDVVVNTSTYNFGETVATYIPEEKEGYTFKGWVNEPKTMPAENIEVTGSYEVNMYTITYKVGDEIVHTADFAFGADVTPFNAPVKEGYTFKGWVGEPAIMPAENVEVTGSYEVNVYVLTFVADGVEVDKVEYTFGATVSPVEAPAKEGYTFVSWDTLPTTMPADDITVTAVYKVNKYNLNYYINDELFETVKVDFGAAVVPLAYEAQYGYTFSGWNGVPATMPAEDVNVYATETANEWTITFEVTGETSAGVVTAYTATYGSAIVAPAMPEISGYSFSWDNVPATMPNNDVTITGSYKVIVSEEAKILYGSIQTSLYDEMTTDEILAAMTASGNVIDNVSMVETQEYSFPVYTPTVDFNPDNLDDDEFEAYEENYRYCLYFVIPRDVSSFALIESGISDVTRFYFKDEKHQNFTMDGKVYDIWRMSNLNGTRKDLPISGMIADKYAYTLIVNN